MASLLPIVLSGGAGTRLWPVSRSAHPKPFMPLPDGESLLQKTLQRALSLPQSAGVLTVTNQRYQFACAAEANALPQARNQPLGYLLEPVGRNTAPALALATLYAATVLGPETVLLALAADHLIENQQNLLAAVDRAVEQAKAGRLVTFGIKPERPETGFGYIEQGETVADGVYRVARFTEKPNLATAETMLATGRYWWNASIFCFRADTMLTELREHTDWFEAAESIWNEIAPAGPTTALPTLTLPADFAHLPDISVDYAVMEKSRNVVVVPCDLGWSDIGSWTAMAELTPPDAGGNRTIGETVLVGSKNNYVTSDRLVAAVGVEDLVIVDTDDALLVAHRDRVQDVKKAAEELKRRAHPAFELHATVHRPWGSYSVLEEGPGFKVKRIVVKPGASLSLQMHHHRSEHWVVVQGMAKVHNNGDEFFLRSNESTYIKAGHKHRLENPGRVDLVMIEVQSGEYLGEDDIVRFEDRYGRT